MIKIHETATPIEDDAGAKLGALVGVIVGIILTYCGVMAVGHNTGPIAVLAVGSGLILGLIVGSAVGAKLDHRLTPKTKLTIEEDVASPKRHNKGRIH